MKYIFMQDGTRSKVKCQFPNSRPERSQSFSKNNFQNTQEQENFSQDNFTQDQQNVGGNDGDYLDDPLLFVKSELENLRGLVRSVINECNGGDPNFLFHNSSQLDSRIQNIVNQSLLFKFLFSSRQAGMNSSAVHYMVLRIIDY